MVNKQGNKEKNFISAVVYLRNDEEYVTDFIQKLYGQLHTNFEKFEIICVNDASADQTVAKVKKIAEGIEGTTVTILNMSFYHGLELSMNAGVDLAIGDFVFEFDKMDTDCMEETLKKVYNKSLEGYDIVSASPKGKQKLTSRLFYSIFNRFTNNQYKLRTDSFRMLSRRAINRITAMTKTIPYRKAVYANCGLSCATVEFTATNAGKKAKETHDSGQRSGLAVDALILFTDVAYKFSIGMTVTMMVIAAIMAGYAVIIYLLGNPVAGWTTTIGFLSFAFFALFGILTIVVKYLSILVDLIFKKKNYTFESIEKITK